MGKIEIIDREWVHEDSRFWFQLDGPVTIETQETHTKEPEKETNDCWLITTPRQHNDCWILQSSNPSKTNNHKYNLLNEYPDSPKEVFCRFTTQIIDYQKPISFSPHNETLKWRREEK